MKHFNNNVAYMEDSDFDATGNLVNPKVPKDIPVVIMAQASWCPHCTTAKPAFQEFANKNAGKIFCATIHSDGDRETEKALGKRMKTIKPGFRGFPEYLCYNGGKRDDKDTKGRGVKDLEEFSRG